MVEIELVRPIKVWPADGFGINAGESRLGEVGGSLMQGSGDWLLDDAGVVFLDEPGVVDLDDDVLFADDLAPPAALLRPALHTLFLISE